MENHAVLTEKINLHRQSTQVFFLVVLRAKIQINWLRVWRDRPNGFDHTM